jgi:putative restriction endonuclease
MNAVLKREDDLGYANYILHPSPDHNYWANISAGRLGDFVARRGDAFNLVIVGSPKDEGDFYAIPYPVVKQALTEEFRSIDWTGRVRWVATIRNHQLKVGRYPVPIDVGAFFGSHSTLTSPGVLEPGTAADLNDYAIENHKIEIEQRQKQSVFRRRVLQNFEGQCCLSGISEDEVLVASHIVPWVKRIDTRLDPANGLLLYCPYDRLFDKGFITFDDSLRVVVTPLVTQCSPPLRTVLEQLTGQQARRPVKWAIKPEYLAFHRSEVWRSGSPAAGVPLAAQSAEA